MANRKALKAGTMEWNAHAHNVVVPFPFSTFSSCPACMPSAYVSVIVLGELCPCRLALLECVKEYEYCSTYSLSVTVARLLVVYPMVVGELCPYLALLESVKECEYCSPYCLCVLQLQVDCRTATAGLSEKSWNRED